MLLDAVAAVRRDAPSLLRIYARCRLRQGRVPTKAEQRSLFRFSSDIHRIEHGLILAGMGPPSYFEDFHPDLVQVRDRLGWWGVRQGSIRCAMRGFWAVGRIGKAAVPFLKKQYTDARTPLHVVHGGFGLATIALRHRKLRAEVERTLRSSERRHFDNADYECIARTIREQALAALAEPEKSVQVFTEIGRGAAGRLLGHPAPEAADDEYAISISDDVAKALAANLLLDFGSGSVMALALPWLAHAEPEDFYLPEAALAQFDIPGWHYEFAFEVLQACGGHYGSNRPARRSGDKISRNDPCPCGSGRKFKRCCVGGIERESDSDRGEQGDTGAVD
jgi:hypothetical protein